MKEAEATSPSSAPTRRRPKEPSFGRSADRLSALREERSAVVALLELLWSGRVAVLFFWGSGLSRCHIAGVCVLTAPSVRSRSQTCGAPCGVPEDAEDDPSCFDASVNVTKPPPFFPPMLLPHWRGLYRPAVRSSAWETSLQSDGQWRTK